MTSDFIEFQTKCCQAYNLLRHNSNKIISLFMIMLIAGMSELQKKEEKLKLEIKLSQVIGTTSQRTYSCNRESK